MRLTCIARTPDEQALAREQFFSSVSGSSSSMAKSRPGAQGGSMSGHVARSLLFTNDSWETIQNVREVGKGGSSKERVVEYVLGRPWQTDYSTLDPSTSFLLSQGQRGIAGGGLP